mgnify:CR=1 FL=1
MRRAHYLKGNSRVELPQHMIFVDTETKGVEINETREEHRLWFGYGCHIRIRGKTDNGRSPEDWLRFTEADDFWEWVDVKSLARTRLWVFAHNWNFDAGILNVSVALPSLGWELVRYINEKPPFILEFRKGNRTLRLTDTLNYFAGSLASIGESIGVPKLKFPSVGDSQHVWDTYGKRDVVVIKEAVLALRRFVETHQLGNFQPTLAAQAFNAYRHRFMDSQILIHNYSEDNQLEREGYFGGRTECFYLGEVKEKLYYLDINSMYPHVMKKYRYPTRHWRARNNVTFQQLYEYRENHALVVYCRINTDVPCYPVRIDHRLCFPVGRMDTVLNTPELDYALAHGHIEKIHRVIIYEHGKLFERYVDFFYNLRQQYKADGNETFQYLCKIILNSLYGKFGQSGQKWKDIGPVDDPFEGIMYEQETEDSPIQKLRCRMGMLQEFERHGESENSFPAIAAHVTAYGRMMLWNLMQKAGRENVYYCDTDSIIVSEAGYKALVEDLDVSALGKLKMEDVSNKTNFWGAKDYHFADSIKHKGIKKNARQLAENRWEQEKWVSWDYLISQGHDGYIPIETVQKTLHRIYKKGTTTDSGWVKPLIVGVD